MSQNIELTDIGIVELESILNSYKRVCEEEEVVEDLFSRCGEVMAKSHYNGEPMESQTHIFYTDNSEEDKVLTNAMDWAYNKNGNKLAKQILEKMN